MAARRSKKKDSPRRKRTVPAPRKAAERKSALLQTEKEIKRLNAIPLLPKPAPDTPAPQDRLFIVGVGASAGGLEAFRSLFRAMPPDTGMAFVLVPHLEPTHVSILPELLAKETRMQIRQVEDGMAVEPNRIYIIPPDADLEIFKGVLRLTGRKYRRQAPIDNFLSSLAADQRDRVVGIILSGMGSDGTAGLRAIKEAGGRTLVQYPDTAKFNAMPHSAISAGVAEFMVPSEEMARVLQAFSTRAAVPRPKEDRPLTEPLAKIFSLVRNSTGHDFSSYKRSTIVRRIERRMSAHGIKNISEYAHFLIQNQSEIDALFKEILIFVTRFFRDPEAFEALKKDFLPVLLRDRPDEVPLRVWVVACSTGEEAYSLAMVLQEYIEEFRPQATFQIFATDLDEDSINIARGGVYGKTAADDVPPQYLKRFFVKERDSFRVRRDIREKIIFAVQDVIKDPPFTKVDLISCRNLLIYMDADLQARIIPIFHYSLNPKGILFLGTSEMISGSSELFSMADRKWKIFRRRDRPDHRAADIDLSLPLPRGHGAGPALARKSPQRQTPGGIERNLLTAYTPPCVVINANAEILYLHGRTGPYLEPPSREARLNLYEMAREGLKEKLPNAIHRASSQNRSVSIRNLAVKNNGGMEVIDLVVQPLPGHDSQGLLMVAFEKPASPDAAEKTGPLTRREKKRIQGVEEELQYTRESLKSAIEELQTTTEEQKSIAEEYMSTNEELQSANEELESSREEMQSLNEELTTVNAELQNKIEDLARSNEEISHFTDSLEIPSIFLDENLRIRRFTTQISRIVNFIRTDVGRPIKDIVANLRDADLVGFAESVRNTRRPVEKEVETRDGRGYLMRGLPTEKSGEGRGGVVLIFIDITEKASWRDQMRAMRTGFDFSGVILETLREPIIVLDPELRALSASPSFYKTFQLTPDDAVGRPFFEVAGGGWNIPGLRRIVTALMGNAESFRDYPVEGDFPGIGRKKMMINARRIRFGEGSDRILLAFESA